MELSPRAALCDAASDTIVSPLMRMELVTTLKRKATDLLGQLSNDHEPVLIIQHRLPAA